jgi:hypothetical protein
VLRLMRLIFFSFLYLYCLIKDSFDPMYSFLLNLVQGPMYSSLQTLFLKPTLFFLLNLVTYHLYCLARILANSNPSDSFFMLCGALGFHISAAMFLSIQLVGYTILGLAPVRVV